MNRPTVKLLAPLAVAAFLVLPRPADAWITVFRSSMTAECIGLGGDCQLLRFTLDVEGDHRLLGVGLLNYNTSVWNFAGIESVTNASGENVEWWTTLWEPNEIELQLAVGFGYPAVEPIVLTMNAQGSTGGQDDLANSFAYFGAGCQGLDTSTCDKLFLVEGHVGVVPEPETIVLLAIGLALLGGLAMVRGFS